ncbi:PPAR-gamma DNA-binding domain-interacting protein 1 [Collichthys lucidus]|uniref:PPAR-gamma DNA-binding domain-interacting protein 1 n=1 Tax=Collichthys lucidus TaxID=240159 RepID=A0A4V6APE9_COLLU|nr:PPAR-gamma DNA-binding domain-interacting protein 1 [Collichthys lucidus]
MLECEALMALGLAGPNTRVVLAGDHMQMGPKLFSVDDHHRSNHTLLNRLFHYYQGQNCDAAQSSRIIFSENYRSTKEIVEFVSTHFYVGEGFSITEEDITSRLDMREVITFTIDPEGAKVLDDAISVKEIGDHYELGVHIADVASYVSPVVPVEQAPNYEKFPILTKVWRDILSAAKADDIDSMVDLIAADDIYPLLQPLIDEFRRSTDAPSRNYYRDTEEYVQIWKPMCEMESAATAVDESDSIVIENLVVNFNQEQEGTLTGSFFLPLSLINEWAIEVKNMWNPVRKEPPYGLPELNPSQRSAVEKAINTSFTLIQGPPGTGKTIVGVYIVSHFLELNSKNPRKVCHPKDKNKKEVILYCGPSNKSVDVVAEYLLKLGNSIKPLRVYSQQVEMLDYPYPDCTLQFSQRTLRQERSKPELRYKKLLREARTYELEQHDIILCTCTQSSTPSLTKTVSARQILIDECAMATEPQALIPLVCNNNPEKIVLIGDHKQLRPIVKNVRVRKLGMGKSLFERYYMMHKKRAVMLDTQYRMHEDICEFPSNAYYEGMLKTGVEQRNSVLRVGDKTMPIVFGDVKGETVRLVVNTAKGNENSKANQEEKNKVIAIAKKLVTSAKIEQKGIVILSPYNAQVSEIKEALKKEKLEQITVTTITKSQGSEWNYVIISTVCSLPSEKIVKEPDGGWLSKHLGFVDDPNQINVGITRAKEGLCIIGDLELLNCGGFWRELLKHYKLHNAVTDADKITVCPK